MFTFLAQDLFSVTASLLYLSKADQPADPRESCISVSEKYSVLCSVTVTLEFRIRCYGLGVVETLLPRPSRSVS